MQAMELQPILAELRNATEPKIGFLKRAEFGISESGQRLGVFSGSFNPPTIAHVRLCEYAQRHLQLHEILLLLTIVNVDKTQFDFSLEERATMMLTVAQEHPNWSAALCSHGRFVEKAQAVSAAYPKGTEIWFIVGFDTLVRIFEPRFYPDMPMHDALKQFFKLARLAVFPRGDAGEEVVNGFLRRAEVRPFANRIAVLPAEPTISWVSSTLVRQKLSSGERVDELVPSSILRLLRPLAKAPSDDM